MTTHHRSVVTRAIGRSDRPVSRGLRALVVSTAVTTYLLIVVGGVVRVSGAGLGCGTAGGRNDWPYCQGGLLPPLQREAVIEFSHRWLAATVSTLAVVLVAVAWARYRHLRAVAWTSTVFIVLLAIQVVLGAITVYRLLPPEVVMTHLANAELLLGCAVLLTILTVNGGTLRRSRAVAVSPRRRAAARWMAAAAVATYVLVVSGAFVVAKGAGYACAGWPLCGNGLQLDGQQLATYNLGHRVVVGVVTVLLGISVMKVARAFRAERGVRLAGAAASALLLLQVIAGAVLVDSRLQTATRSVHEALASAFWASVILLALLVRPGVLRLAPETDVEQLDEARGDVTSTGARRPPRQAPVASRS